MNLRDALLQPDFAGLDDKAVLAYGNEIVELRRDVTLWTYRGVVDRFGIGAAERLLGAIKAMGLDGAALTYVYPGIDLSLDVSQSSLDAIAKAVPQLADVCAALKEFGITHGTRWQLLGIDPVPSVDEITKTRIGIMNQRAKASFLNETLNALISDESKSMEDIKTAVASMKT